MEFSFFTTDNKSGYKTREKWFSKNYPNEYTKIIDYCKPYNLKTFKEKVWFYYKKLTEIPKCSGCGKEVGFSGRFDRGYKSFCTLKCANENGDLTERVKKTIRKKYNVDFYTQHKDFIHKGKQTKKEKYGNENYNNVEKMLITKKEKYGNENYNNVEKIKKTSVERYGVENPSKSVEVINKIKK